MTGVVLMVVPEVGALVRVRYSGVVRESSAESRGGFWLTVPADALLRTPEISSWVPPVASVEVLSPPRPREVLLLECGHVCDAERPASPSGTVYCWRWPCHTHKSVERIGRVEW